MHGRVPVRSAVCRAAVSHHVGQPSSSVRHCRGRRQPRAECFLRRFWIDRHRVSQRFRSSDAGDAIAQGHSRARVLGTQLVFAVRTRVSGAQSEGSASRDGATWSMTTRISRVRQSSSLHCLCYRYAKDYCRSSSQSRAPVTAALPRLVAGPYGTGLPPQNPIMDHAKIDACEQYSEHKKDDRPI